MTGKAGAGSNGWDRLTTVWASLSSTGTSASHLPLLPACTMRICSLMYRSSGGKVDDGRSQTGTRAGKRLWRGQASTDLPVDYQFWGSAVETGPLRTDSSKPGRPLPERVAACPGFWLRCLGQGCFFAFCYYYIVSGLGIDQRRATWPDSPEKRCVFLSSFFFFCCDKASPRNAAWDTRHLITMGYLATRVHRASTVPTGRAVLNALLGGSQPATRHLHALRVPPAGTEVV